MIRFRRLAFVGLVAATGPFAMVACSSSDSPSTPPTDAGKTDSGSKTPSTKTSSAPTGKATTKPPAKPTASATAPKSEPPATPPKSPDLASGDLLTESGFEIDASCAKAGLTDNKGYCLDGGDYLIGCVGGKLLGIDCGALNSGSQAVSCEDDPKAGCYAIDLSPVVSDVTDDAAGYGAAIDQACLSSQEGKGFCLDTYAVVCSPSPRPRRAWRRGSTRRPSPRRSARPCVRCAIGDASSRAPCCRPGSSPTGNRSRAASTGSTPC